MRSTDIDFGHCNSVSEIFALLADYKKKGVRFAWADQTVTADYIAAAIYKAIRDIAKNVGEVMIVQAGRWHETMDQRIQNCLMVVSNKYSLRSTLHRILEREGYHPYLPEALARTVMGTPGDYASCPRIEYAHCRDLHELLAMVYEQEMQNRTARKKKGSVETDQRFGSPYWLANFIVKMVDKYKDRTVLKNMETGTISRQFYEREVEELPAELRGTINRIFRHQENIALSCTAVIDLICAPYREIRREVTREPQPTIMMRTEQKQPTAPVQGETFSQKFDRHRYRNSIGIGMAFGFLLLATYHGVLKKPTPQTPAETAQTTDTSEDKNAISEEQREQLLLRNGIAERFYVPVAKDIIRASDTFVMLPDGTVFNQPTEEQKQLAIDRLGEMQTQLTAHLQDGSIIFYVEHPGEARDLGYLSSVARWSKAGTVDNPSDDTLYLNRVFFDQLQRYWIPAVSHEHGHAYSGGLKHKGNIEDLNRNSEAFMQKVQENHDYPYYLSGIMRLPDDIMQYHVTELHNNPKADLQLHDNKKELHRWRERMLDYVDVDQDQLAYLGVSTEEIEGIITRNNLWELMNLLMEAEIKNPEGEFYTDERLKPLQPKELRSRRK